MNRRDFLLSTSGLLLAPALSQAQVPAPQQSPWLEKIAQQLCEEFKVPAVWLAGGTDGRIEQAVYGVRKAGDPTQASLTDRLMVGSITKPMTGIWLASLVEQGRITYDARMLDILPELKPDCLPEHRNIVLRQLVTHTAGLEGQADNWVVDIKRPDLYPQERLRFAREVLRKPSPSNSTGKSFYSNAGFTIAGTMGERVSGLTYEQAIPTFYRNRVSLASWGLGEPNLKCDLSGAWPHEMKEGKPVPFLPTDRHYIGAQPSGGAHSTIGDLARFGQAILRGYAGAGEILNPGTWRSILTPIPNAAFTVSGFGHANWDVITFSHQGGVGGGSSELWLLPEYGLIFAAHYTTSWPEGNLKALARAHELVVDELRHRRGQRIGPRNSVSIARITTVDANGREIVPKHGDGKVRIAIEVDVRGGRCGDIKITAKLGDELREANYFRGLGEGRQRCATFTWDMPEALETPFVAIVDACQSCGDTDPKGKRMETSLRIAGN